MPALLASGNPDKPGFRISIDQIDMISFGGVQPVLLNVEQLQNNALLVLAAAASSESSIALSSFCKSKIRFIF
jgi:hypothetical protein